MPLNTLSLEALPKLRGGLVSAMLAKALKRMADDIEQAPDIATWRNVVLEIRGKPKCEGGELVDVEAEYVVKGKVPERVATSRLLIRRNPRGENQLMFAEDSEDNAFQQTFDDASDEE